MIVKLVIISIMLLPLIFGCTITGKHWQTIDGREVLTERMEMRGCGGKRFKTTSNAELEKEMPAKIPDIIPTK